LTADYLVNLLFLSRPNLFSAVQVKILIMTHLFQSEKVQYLCTCGSLKPLCQTYFCRHCLALKCGKCVFHEVGLTNEKKRMNVREIFVPYFLSGGYFVLLKLP